MGTNEYGRLNVTGVLTTTGWNYYIFKDRKHWDFIVHYKADGSDTVMTQHCDVEYFNGGIKAGVAWEATVVFIPSGTDIRSLHNLTCYRGLRLSIESLLVFLDPEFTALFPMKISGGWMPSDVGNLFIASAHVGIGVSPITFPKMIFKLKDSNGKPLKLHENRGHR